MPRKCTICTHDQLAAINAKIINGVSFRAIALQHGVNYMAVNRHADKHIPAALTQAQEAKEIAAADTLLTQLEELRVKAWSLLQQAELAGDLRTAISGIREARGCLETLGKLAGELQQEGTVNITLTPGWIAIRTTIIEALEPFPEALLALSKAWDDQEDSSDD